MSANKRASGPRASRGRPSRLELARSPSKMKRRDHARNIFPEMIRKPGEPGGPPAGSRTRHNDNESGMGTTPHMHSLKNSIRCRRPRGGVDGLVRHGVILCPLLVLLGACTTVSIQTADDKVRIERHWGVLAVEFVEPEASHVAEVSALGLLQSPFGWSAGYSHQSWAALGPECRLVLWVTAPEHIETARRLADSSPGVCAISPPTTHTEDSIDAQ